MAAENHELSQVSSQAPSNFSSTSIEGNRTPAAVPDKNVDKTPIIANASSPIIKDFSDWSPWEKQLIVFTASTAALFSPLSANIYFPIFNTLANDLHVTDTMINLTVTTYMIFQGLIPTIIGGASDGLGRRPAYILCFIIYTAANIGLALQDQYSALIVLRCLQSAGSSSTVALANAVVADIATASERGTYISYATAGTYTAPAIGPIIGGLLAHYLGWRSVFWFLVIFGATFFVPLLLFFPETCRKIVGDGSIRPAKWNMSILTAWHLRRNARARSDKVDTQPSIQKPPFKILNPFAALIIIFEKEVGLVLASMAMAFGAFYAVTSALPSTYEEIYGFNDIQIALCFIPVGAGSIFAVVTQGRMVDYNYRRYAKRLGISVVKTKQQDLTDFPIERARLEIAIPALLRYGVHKESSSLKGVSESERSFGSFEGVLNYHVFLAAASRFEKEFHC